MPADPALLSPWLAALEARPSDVVAPFAAAARPSPAPRPSPAAAIPEASRP